jgi:hypothetical protein
MLRHRRRNPSVNALPFLATHLPIMDGHMRA